MAAAWLNEKQWFTVTKYGISVAILHLEREYEYLGWCAAGALSSPPRCPQARRGAWLYLRTRGEARRARRHERMLEREHLQESPSGRPHEELGTEL